MGIKNQKKDPALIVADPVSLANPPIAAGVFTKNRVCAAPVWVCREHLQDPSVQSIVVNSGNANACTGDEGMSNARQMTELTASALSIPSDQVLVCSTGEKRIEKTKKETKREKGKEKKRTKEKKKRKKGKNKKKKTEK